MLAAFFVYLPLFQQKVKNLSKIRQIGKICEGKRLVISLTENYEFQRVYKKGQSYPGRYAVVYYHASNRANSLRLGITATKKIGKACVRNRARRLIYENMRLFLPKMKPGYDIVVVARAAIVGADFFALGKELQKLLQKAGAFHAE